MTTQASHAPMLVDALRTLDDDTLAELLRRRPDLLTPVPSDLDQLAARALTRGSVLRALDRLDRRTLAVLEARVVLPDPVREADLAEAVGLGQELFDHAVSELRQTGLLWGTPDQVAAPEVLAETLGSYPAGLGPPARSAFASYAREQREQVASGAGDDPVAVLENPERIGALLDEVGEPARALAHRLAEGPPIGTLPGAEQTAARASVDALWSRGLLATVDQHTVVLPREVGIWLRGGRVQRPETLAPPQLDGRTHNPARVDQAAVGSALDLVRYVEQILTAWSEHPPPVLRSGGLGVRELRRSAGLVEVDEATAALLLESAYAAGLLAAGEDESWLPTAMFDGWTRSDTDACWAALVRAWVDSIRVPGLVGSRDERDRPRNTLSDDLDRTSAPLVRSLVLEALAAVEPGTALTEDDVLAYVRWRVPRRANTFLADLVRWTLQEAAVLGVTGLGALSAPGRALAAGADPAGAIRPLLPEPVEHVVLQGDLTAIAPGPLTPELARAFGEVADTESHGGATVYRFSTASVRRALDAGRSAEDLHALLSQHSTTPVPQPLSYLIDDVARRHGHLRAGQASSYLRCDDPAVLEALLADQQASSLQLRQIAPTVVVSTQPMRTLVDELRSLGYAPSSETAEGSLVLSMPERRRAPEPRRRAPVRSERSEPDPELVQAGVRALRAGDRARASRPEGLRINRAPRSASTEAVTALRAALSEGQTVWLGYVDQHGGTSDRLVDPLRLDGGWLMAYDHAAGSSRSFALHRITGAVPVEADPPA